MGIIPPLLGSDWTCQPKDEWVTLSSVLTQPQRVTLYARKQCCQYPHAWYYLIYWKRNSITSHLLHIHMYQSYIMYIYMCTHVFIYIYTYIYIYIHVFFCIDVTIRTWLTDIQMINMWSLMIKITTIMIIPVLVSGQIPSHLVG